MTAAAIALVLVFPGSPPKKEAVPPVARSLLDRWVSAVRKRDIKAVASLYKKSDALIVILSGGQMAKGHDAVMTMYKTSFAAAKFDLVTLKTIAAKQHGDTIWAVCRFQADLTTTADGSKYRLICRSSFVFERSNKSWQIVLEHSSPISGTLRLKKLE